MVALANKGSKTHNESTPGCRNLPCENKYMEDINRLNEDENIRGQEGEAGLLIAYLHITIEVS